MTIPASTNLFENIPPATQEELFETLLRNDHAHIERIVSRGHVTAEGDWYDQAWDEWILLLKGQAILRYHENDVLVTLNVGDSLLIPAHAKHRVEWTLPNENTVWLAVHLY